MFALLGRDNATTAGGYTSNGVTIQENITARGSSFCLVVCAVMGVTCLVNLGLSYLKPSTERVFFHIVAVINFTAFIVYYTMGSNLGWTPVNVGTVQPSSPDGTYRSVFYIRYIDWAITTPLVVVNLLLTAGMPLSTIVYVMFWDEVMVVSGLGGALTSTRYKFGMSFTNSTILSDRYRVLRYRLRSYAVRFLSLRFCRSQTSVRAWQRHWSNIHCLWYLHCRGLGHISHSMGAFRG